MHYETWLLKESLVRSASHPPPARAVRKTPCKGQAKCKAAYSLCLIARWPATSLVACLRDSHAEASLRGASGFVWWTPEKRGGFARKSDNNWLFSVLVTHKEYLCRARLLSRQSVIRTFSTLSFSLSLLLV